MRWDKLGLWSAGMLKLLPLSVNHPLCLVRWHFGQPRILKETGADVILATFMSCRTHSEPHRTIQGRDEGP